jgi:ribosomal protein L12E/L44/L45/RPP1/RPP2
MRVISIEPDKQRLGLSLKEVTEEEMEPWLEQRRILAAAAAEAAAVAEAEAQAQAEAEAQAVAEGQGVADEVEVPVQLEEAELQTSS